MINTRNLRDPGNAHLVQLLLQKLHERYQFPPEYDNQNLKDNVVNQLALTKMSTALASWRTRVKKRIDKKESWEEIKKHKPLLEHDDYVLFKEELETDTFKALSALGKKMYEQKVTTVLGVVKEICPRGNNNIVIIIFLVHDNVYTPCYNCIKRKL
jgi:hypothetical protein